MGEMKAGTIIAVFAAAIAVVVGVVFSHFNPTVAITDGLAALFGLIGVLLALAGYGAWLLLKRRQAHGP